MVVLDIIVGCEESQAVAMAFRALGHNAYSCDQLPCSGGHPEYHIQGDVFKAIHSRKWDAGIFFPPCTYLTRAGSGWFKEQPPLKSGKLVGKEREKAREEAIKFFMDLYNCDIPVVGMENPRGVLSSRFRKPDQVIQPWQYGHGEQKATCLWLRNLPKLTPTKVVAGREQRLFLLSPDRKGREGERARLRSKTYPGIAEAMARQWSDYLTGADVL